MNYFNREYFHFHLNQIKLLFAPHPACGPATGIAVPIEAIEIHGLPARSESRFGISSGCIDYGAHVEGAGIILGSCRGYCEEVR